MQKLNSCSGKMALHLRVTISTHIANGNKHRKKWNPCTIINRVNNQRGNMEITAKQKCKCYNVINDLFYFSGKPLDHNTKPALTQAWEEQSWLSVTLIDGSIWLISYHHLCFEANITCSFFK